MESVRQYLLSVTAAAIVCALISNLCVKKGTVSTIIKLLSGLFLALTVVKPVIYIELSDFLSFSNIVNTDAAVFVSEGENFSRSEMEDIIKSKTEAYILDKAETLGATLHVEVTLENGMPAQVSLSGSISPYGKTQLSVWLEEELGIPVEAQSWTGQH